MKHRLVYMVNRVRISASEYNMNGYTQTFLFRDKIKAEKRLNDLRSEDLSELDRLNCNYEIYTDSDEKFHISWDSDQEMVFITLNKKIIE